MKKQIIFDLTEKYFNYGKADADNGIFDTAYLKALTNDAAMSYMAGWRSSEQDHTNFKVI